MKINRDNIYKFLLNNFPYSLVQEHKNNILYVSKKVFNILLSTREFILETSEIAGFKIIPLAKYKEDYTLGFFINEKTAIVWNNGKNLEVNLWV